VGVEVLVRVASGDSNVHRIPLKLDDSIYGRAGNHEDETKILDALDFELGLVPVKIGQGLIKIHGRDSYDVRLRYMLFAELE